ncbi:MAG: NAD(P)-dependent dehydrogenase (short-subunit alcohol dehydrogenase family) [Candidatus Azotimanducaceae bacterium]|jgi:NAD(P)-dependent dehydrogenase (short-subunit alcohol dehydrogenase family)
MFEFSGKVAVVTGGASGIGLGMVRAFAERDMKIVVADLDDDAIKATLEELSSKGIEAIGQRCDVAKLEQVEALAAATMQRFGQVNVLCNNAGVGIPTPTSRFKLDDWEWIINVDLWGPIYGVKTFLPLIEEAGEGHINSTSSMAGLISTSTLSAYSVAKHGVVALMAALERELRHKKSAITASVLCPGPINTNISQHSVDYRPSHQDKPKRPPKENKTTASIQASLEAGMQPDEVGELVAQAIVDNKFWILTHPHWAKGVQKQLDALREDQTLTRG